MPKLDPRDAAVEKNHQQVSQTHQPTITVPGHDSTAFPWCPRFFINHDISRINCGPLVLSLSCCLKLDASCNIILPDERLINLKLNEARMQLVDRVCLLALVFVELFSSEKITFCVTKNCFLFFSFLSFSFSLLLHFQGEKSARDGIRKALPTGYGASSANDSNTREVLDKLQKEVGL